MNRALRHSKRALIGLLLAGAIGCGGTAATPAPLVPVTGTVTLDQDPLSGTLVTFLPIGDTRGGGATGYTDKSGYYELQSPDDRAGAPVGTYRVIVTKLVMPDGSDFPVNSEIAPMDSPARQVLPDRYSDERQTTLTVTVPAGGGQIDLPLTSGP